DEDGEAITTMVVDWPPPGAATAAPPLPDDPWIAGCAGRAARGHVAAETGAVSCLGRARGGKADPVPNSCPQLTPYYRERVGDASWGRPGGEDGQSRDCPRGVLPVYAGRPPANPTQSLQPRA